MFEADERQALADSLRAVHCAPKKQARRAQLIGMGASTPSRALRILRMSFRSPKNSPATNEIPLANAYDKINPRRMAGLSARQPGGAAWYH